MNKKFFYFLTIFFFVSNNAHAYLDPGTGAFILQALAVILASIITFFTFFINKVKSILSKIKKFFKKKLMINYLTKDYFTSFWF